MHVFPIVTVVLAYCHIQVTIWYGLYGSAEPEHPSVTMVPSSWTRESEFPPFSAKQVIYTVLYKGKEY